MGFVPKKEFPVEILKISAWKLVYFAFALVLPLLMTPIPIIWTILGFVCMHFITGLLITTVFQTAHIMPNMKYPVSNEKGFIEDEWTVHQLATTTNFSPKNRWFSWLIGGLNFQVEHHLFPNICHVHYRKISPIVAKTAA